MMLRNVCLSPTTSFWPLTLRLRQTYTSSPQYRSCGRWLSSRWWAVCPCTSSSTYADASPRPATPSWPLKDWEEPPASFTVGKQKGVPVFIQPSLRLHQRIKHGFIPFNLSWKVRLGNVKDGQFSQGQAVYWEGEFVLKSSVTCYTCLMQRLTDDFSMRRTTVVNWGSSSFNRLIYCCPLRIMNIQMSWAEM